MNISLRLRRQLYWLNFPSVLLIALLQRSPALQLMGMAEEMLISSPLGAVLRSVFVGAVSLGVMDTMAGATQLSISTPSPLAATVGTPIAGVAFEITGTPSVGADSYDIGGNMPPGLSFNGVTSGSVQQETIFLSGTPAVAGTYTISITAENVEYGSLGPYSYTIIVGGGGGGNTAPSITLQPSSQTVTAGATVSFTAAASGTPAPTYQWQKNSVNIPGATSGTLTLTNVQVGDSATYTMVAANSVSSATSTGAVLTVNSGNTAPSITLQPVSQSANLGTTVTFTAAANGTPAPSYQWQKNSINIPGATSGTLTLTNVQAGDGATYTLVATNSVSSATTNGAVLTVNVPPAIIAQPSSQSVTVGATVTFTAAASGTPAPAYQWQKNSVSIPGATNATLTLTNVQLGDAGTYTLVATNVANSATSNGAVLTVNLALVAPSITTQPVSQTALVGAIVTFTAAADGNPVPTYQWQKNSSDIPGATGSTLTLTNVQLGDAGTYTLVATNSVSTATSNGAVLTVNAAPAITTQPVSQSATVGATVTFTGAASGTPAPTYQWQKNGTDIPGATNGTLSLTNVQLGDAGTYTLIATNVVTSATSNGAVLTVNAPPVITLQPVSQKVRPGSTVTFTAAASGAPAPTYQWQKNGVDISGATSSTLTLTNVHVSDNGTYTVIATNVVTSVISNGAVLTVRTVPRDFDGDGKSDIVLTNTVTGNRAVWIMNGATITTGLVIGTLPTDWVISGTGDFNGDGKADIVLTNTVTGARAVWIMNGATITTGLVIGTLSTDWVISGVGDFDGDGKDDIVLTNTVTGNRAVWIMNGATITTGLVIGTLSTDWVISGTGDFDGDGKADIVLTNTVTGNRAVWIMNGATITTGLVIGTLSTDWVISGTGDFDGDGKADIVLTNTVTGNRAVWIMNGATITTGLVIGTLSTDWVISGTGDFDGDGKADIVLTNTVTGNRAVWIMNGATITTGLVIGTLPIAWTINH